MSTGSPTSSRDTGSWRAKRRRDRIALWVFALLGVGSIVLAGSLQFAEGDQRVMVVTMERGVGEGARERLKAACGELPGISVVPDKGNPDPAIQGRFPVRFRIGGTTSAQEAALEACLARHDDIVRGFLAED